MKHAKLILLIVSIFSMVLVIGCSKKSDDSNPVIPGLTDPNDFLGSASVTINGAGYSNKVLSFNYGIGLYGVQENLTYCQLYTQTETDSAYVGIMFPGNGTGNFAWSSMSDTSYNGVSLMIEKGDGSVEYYFADGNGSTNVKSYGAVGARIEGDFSGKLYSITDSISVSGNFSITRSADVNNIDEGTPVKFKIPITVK